MKHARRWLPFVIVSLTACGDSSSPVAETPTSTTTTAPAAAAVDPDLTGTWMGQIEGTNANATASGALTMTLNGDGTMSASSTNPAFRPVNGTWGVSESTFRAAGTDPNGTTVTFTAPRSTTELNGTFSTGSGAAGTFVVTKQ